MTIRPVKRRPALARHTCAGAPGTGLAAGDGIEDGAGPQAALTPPRRRARLNAPCEIPFFIPDPA